MMMMMMMMTFFWGSSSKCPTQFMLLELLVFPRNLLLRKSFVDRHVCVCARACVKNSKGCERYWIKISSGTAHGFKRKQLDFSASRPNKRGGARKPKILYPSVRSYKTAWCRVTKFGVIIRHRDAKVPTPPRAPGHSMWPRCRDMRPDT